jgi:hypothetical protein
MFMLWRRSGGPINPGALCLDSSSMSFESFIFPHLSNHEAIPILSTVPFRE